MDIAHRLSSFKNVAHLLEKDMVINVDHDHYVAHGCRSSENKALSDETAGQALAMGGKRNRMHDGIRLGCLWALGPGESVPSSTNTPTREGE